MNNVAVSPYNVLPEVLKDFRLSKNIVIYDSTLRDGEQMPKVSFSSEQKLAIARKLDEIGVPEIEAGFPAVSKTEQEIVKTIANEGLNAKILVLSRLKKEDIDAAIQSDADLVLLFIASSPLHLKYKLHLSEEEIKEVALGHGYCFASNRITIDGKKIKYMYRESPEVEEDSGWRFFAGD